MRILNVTHFYSLHGGGIERVAEHLCRELAARGHDITWAASSADAVPAGMAAMPLACVNPTEALTGLPMPIPRLGSMMMLIGGVRRADAVIIHDALYVTSIIALLAARWCRRPVVLVQHIAGITFASAIMRFVMKIATATVTRPMLRGATQVVFISNSVMQAFANVQLRASAKLVFNGVDQLIFHAVAQPDEAAAFRRVYQLPSTGGLVAFVGRFVSKKGLAVVREVAFRRPDLTFVLAGSGPIDPTSWNLSNVRVLGSLAPNEVARLFRSATALLLPSVGEGYPLVVQEALACGLPVICGIDSAKADPGAEEWLHAVRIDHADPAGTALRVVPILAKRLCDATSSAAMATYAARTYSWPAAAATISTIFENAVFVQPARHAAS